MINNLYNNVYTLYNSALSDSTNYVEDLSHNELIVLADKVNSVLERNSNIDDNIKNSLSLPQLVVVGAQSSGKSSVLNSIMTMDILPTGKNMVTRTPLKIRLVKLNNGEKSYVCFENEEHDQIDIDHPLPSTEQIKNIRKRIKRKTKEIAGESMNIHEKPISFTIFSPSVPNLSLVDLPGLTMVARTDKGQPEDIKKRIENLVKSYINKDNNIVLTIMQAKEDLETDIGLHLVKHNEIKKTIGIITKPDLMNSDEHIGKYLLNNISKNLMLEHGYYVVKGRNSTQMNSMNIIDALRAEKQYFKNHEEYSKYVYSKRIGTSNLTSNLTNILTKSIHESLPVVMSNISEIYNDVVSQLLSLGGETPITLEGKLSELGNFISEFYKFLVNSIDSKDLNNNLGKSLKNTFISYRKNIINSNPFIDLCSEHDKNNISLNTSTDSNDFLYESDSDNNNENTETDKLMYDENYFTEIINNYEGNHMGNSLSPVKIMETCMLDNLYEPLKYSQNINNNLLNDIYTLFSNTISEILKNNRFSKYPLLAEYIHRFLLDSILSEYKNISRNRIEKLIKDEQSYIWTDEPQFSKILNSIGIDSVTPKYIHELCASYYDSVSKNYANSIPKIIMNEFVTKIKQSLLSELNTNIINQKNIELLKEDSTSEQNRIYLQSLKNDIEEIKKLFTKN